MMVYVDHGGRPRLIGHTVILSRLAAEHPVWTFSFTPPGQDAPVVEQALILSPGDQPEALPGWLRLVP